MKLNMLVRSLAFSFLAAGALGAHASGADNYPDKPIRFVVTFPPGGGTDVLARLIGAELTKSMGQTVLVDNKPGASGNIGVGETIKAPGDGYTLMVAPISVQTANPYLFKPALNPAHVPTDRALARRQQVLDAAAECFRRRGFHGASMAEIAKTAGMSAAVIRRSMWRGAWAMARRSAVVCATLSRT